MTSPIWGMGVAVFLGSERTVLSRQISPDGRRIAAVERLVVADVPYTVAMVRGRWLPDGYLFGCAAASRHGSGGAQLRWTTNRSLAVVVQGRSGWRTGSAPFHSGSCRGLSVAFEQTRS